MRKSHLDWSLLTVKIKLEHGVTYLTYHLWYPHVNNLRYRQITNPYHHPNQFLYFFLKQHRVLGEHYQKYLPNLNHSAPLKCLHDFFNLYHRIHDHICAYLEFKPSQLTLNCSLIVIPIMSIVKAHNLHILLLANFHHLELVFENHCSGNYLCTNFIADFPLNLEFSVH